MTHHAVRYSWTDTSQAKALLEQWGGSPRPHSPQYYVIGPGQPFLRVRNGAVALKYPVLPNGIPIVKPVPVVEERLPLITPITTVHHHMGVQPERRTRKIVGTISSFLEHLTEEAAYAVFQTELNTTYRLGAKGTETVLDSPRGPILIGDQVKVDYDQLRLLRKPGTLIRGRGAAEDVTAVLDALMLPPFHTAAGTYASVFRMFLK